MSKNTKIATFFFVVIELAIVISVYFLTINQELLFSVIAIVLLTVANILGWLNYLDKEKNK